MPAFQITESLSNMWNQNIKTHLLNCGTLET